MNACVCCDPPQSCFPSGENKRHRGRPPPSSMVTGGGIVSETGGTDADDLARAILVPRTLTQTSLPLPSVVSTSCLSAPSISWRSQMWLLLLPPQLTEPVVKGAIAAGLQAPPEQGYSGTAKALDK
jgi:hypothetical protein